MIKVLLLVRLIYYFFLLNTFRLTLKFNYNFENVIFQTYLFPYGIHLGVYLLSIYIHVLQTNQIVTANPTITNTINSIVLRNRQTLKCIKII